MSESDVQPAEAVVGNMQLGLMAVSKRRRALVELIRGEREGRLSFKYITCDYCPMVNRCGSAFDLYNTDGDCLEDK